MKQKKRSHEYLMMMRYCSNLCLIDLSTSVTLHTLKVDLMLCMLGKNFSRLHFKIFFALFFANCVSSGDILHKISNPIFWEK